MDNSKLLVVVALTALLVGAGSFFGGVQYQKSQEPTAGDFQAVREQFGAGERPQGFGDRLQGQGRPVSGEIIGRDEESVTVKLPDGSSRIIFVGDDTQINKSAPGTKDDLAEGVQVLVVGSENPDGSLTATSVQIGD